MTAVADFSEDPVSRDGPCRGTESPTAQVDGEPDNRCHCDGGAPRGRCPRWYPRLRAAIDGPLRAGGVGVLINCAGVSYPHPEYFVGMLSDSGGGGGDGGLAFTTEFCDSADTSVRCNVAAVVHACRLVLPGMLARGRGLVVNVGSASASMPPAVPLMTLYAATKKFLEKLSADLDDECVYLTRNDDDKGEFGVRVQCVRPAYVATAMLRSANPDVRSVCDDNDGIGGGCCDGDVSWRWAWKKRVEGSVERWLVPSARRWVQSALRDGGQLYSSRSRANGPANFTGYWPHTLMVGCAQLVSSLTPRRWFVDHVLIPGMLTYRTKGRTAITETNKRKKDAS